MSSQSFAAEQLLELLLQLKKTTPTAAKQILNSQPQIAYALITLMVTMNAVNFDVFQKTLAEYGAANAQGPAAVPPPSSTPAPAIPPHLQAQPQYRTSTPPSTSVPSSSGYPYPNGHTTPQSYTPPVSQLGYGQPQNQGYGYNQPQQGYPNYPPSYGAPPPTAPPANTAMIPDALAAIPDDQKALIMRVLSMTPEQINMLGPTERSTFIQLRATLGVPTG